MGWYLVSQSQAAQALNHCLELTSMMMTHELGSPTAPILIIPKRFPAHDELGMCRNKSCFSTVACLVHPCKAYYYHSFDNPCSASSLADGGRLIHLHRPNEALCM